MFKLFEKIKDKFIQTKNLIINVNCPGKGAEMNIVYILNKYKTKDVKILNNVYIPTKNGKTTEIDVLMIHPLGIFVFESKDYSGWIYGNEKDYQWTQTLVSYGKTYKNHFYNPIKQNEGHIKALKELIGNVNTYSFVVFTNNCVLKKITRISNNSFLIYKSNLQKTLNNIIENANVSSLSEENINIIYNKLYPFTQVSDEIKRQHIIDISNYKNN